MGIEVISAEEVGARIASCRRELGLTQIKLAQLLDVSERSVQLYEAGTTIPYNHLQLLAETFQRSIGWILHGDAGLSPAERIERIERMLIAVAEKLGVEPLL